MSHAHIGLAAPAPDLAGLVAFYQSVEMPRARLCETLVPAPHYSFIFQFGDGYAYRRDAALRMYPQHMIAGPAGIPVTVHATGRTDALRVAMHPHTAGLVLKTAASGLRNRAVDIGEFFGAEGRELVKRMAAADDGPSRITVFEHWLRRRVRDNDSSLLGEMGYAVKRLADRDGPLRIRDLAAELSVGERQLERWFLRSVGLGPKLFQRILRINAVLREARSIAIDWAALASQFGFADQSHLVREFAALAGATPLACVRDASVLSAVFQESALPMPANHASAAPRGVHDFTDRSMRPAA